MKILIVDDNEQITQLLSKILATKGHDVVTVNLFEECLDVLEKENFNVVIVDAPMPGYDQLNTIHELDKKGILQSHKVILFSGLKISNSLIMDLIRKGL